MITQHILIWYTKMIGISLDIINTYIRLYLWCIHYCNVPVLSIFWSHPNDLSFSQKHTFCNPMENTINTTKANIITCQYFERLTPIILPQLQWLLLKNANCNIIIRFLMHKVTYFEFTDNISSKKSPSNSNHIESINEYSSLSRDNIRPFPCEY